MTIFLCGHDNEKEEKIVVSLVSVAVGIIVLAGGLLGGLTWGSTLRENHDAEEIDGGNGYVQAVGTSLYDGNGKLLRLKGVNVGQGLVTEGWVAPYSVGALTNADGSYRTDADGNVEYPEMTTDEALAGFGSNPNLTDAERKELTEIYLARWFTDDDFKTCKEELSFNALRLPFTWRNLLNEDYSRKDESVAFSYFDWFLGECAKYQIYCILDLHNAPGGQNGYEHGGTWSNDLWTSEENIAATCDLWAYIAEHYLLKEPELGKWIATYDMLNEPCGTTQGETTAVCYAVFDRIYDAIRTVDDVHNITIEFCWDESKFISPAQYGWENVQYEFHMYNWGRVNETLFYDYYELKSLFHRFDVPVFIGEFTCWDEESDWDDELSLFDKRGWSWTLWTYKKTVVGWWNDSWGLKNLKLNLNAGEPKLDLRTATYDELKALFERIDSVNCENSSTFEIVKRYMIR